MNFSRLIATAVLTLIVGCAGEHSAPSDGIKAGALRDPSLANETAPDKFRARFRTTKGDFVIESERRWSPHGVDRLYNLIRIGYFHETPFYRMAKGFVAQFGFHPEPEINHIWKSANIPDDQNIVSNFRGYISFAAAGPNTRSVQMFINLKNNGNLDRMQGGKAFPTVAKIVEGWNSTIAKLTAEYGETPNQGMILNRGKAYIDKEFPNMDKILSAAIIE